MSHELIVECTQKELESFCEKYPEWKVSLEKNKISRIFPLKSYFKGLSFLQSIGWLAQKYNHHPDLELSFSAVKCHLTTHDIGNKISKKDLLLAESIEQHWF